MLPITNENTQMPRNTVRGRETDTVIGSVGTSYLEEINGGVTVLFA